MPSVSCIKVRCLQSRHGCDSVLDRDSEPQLPEENLQVCNMTVKFFSNRWLLILIFDWAKGTWQIFFYSLPFFPETTFLSIYTVQIHFIWNVQISSSYTQLTLTFYDAWALTSLSVQTVWAQWELCMGNNSTWMCLCLRWRASLSPSGTIKPTFWNSRAVCIRTAQK